MRARLTVIGALALATPAAAQEPVAGSGSLNDAPMLEPGEYRDTILPGEQLFYAIRVQPGERLALRATTTMAAEDLRKLVSLVRFRPLGPLREPVEPDGQDDLHGAGTEAAWEVGPAEEASSDPYLGPGTWYVGVHGFWGAGGAPPKAEIPFTFAIERAGEAGSTPAPTATPTPEPTPAPARASVDDAVDPAAVGAVGVSGLLIGLLAGGLAGRRRR